MSNPEIFKELSNLRNRVEQIGTGMIATKPEDDLDELKEEIVNLIDILTRLRETI